MIRLSVGRSRMTWLISGISTPGELYLTFISCRKCYILFFLPHFSIFIQILPHPIPGLKTLKKPLKMYYHPFRKHNNHTYYPYDNHQASHNCCDCAYYYFGIWFVILLNEKKCLIAPRSFGIILLIKESTVMPTIKRNKPAKMDRSFPPLKATVNLVLFLTAGIFSCNCFFLFAYMS